MKVISKKTLQNFWSQQRHMRSQKSLEAWYQEAKNAIWKNMADIKSHYRHASILNSTRVVFNICGNQFRLIVHVNFSCELIFIKFIGNHTEYDKIDARTVNDY